MRHRPRSWQNAQRDCLSDVLLGEENLIQRNPLSHKALTWCPLDEYSWTCNGSTRGVTPRATLFVSALKVLKPYSATLTNSRGWGQMQCANRTVRSRGPQGEIESCPFHVSVTIPKDPNDSDEHNGSQGRADLGSPPRHRQVDATLAEGRPRAKAIAPLNRR